MKRKFFALALSLALFTGSAIGCNSGGSESETTTKATQAATEKESPAESDTGETAAETNAETEPETGGDAAFDDVRLKMLSCWNGGFKVPTDEYNNEIASLIREKIGVTVEIEGIMMSETEKLNLMFASGDMPDMVNAPYWGGSAGETAVIKKAATEGRLLDIKDLVPQYENLAGAYDIGVVSLKYLENDLDDPSFGGARYVLPVQTPSGSVESITNWTYGVFVRGDVPEELGVDPTTIDTPEKLYDFMIQAKEHGFKDINGNDTIVATTYHDGWDYSGYQAGFNEKKLTEYTIEDGVVTFDRLSETWVEKNLFIWKMVNEGILDKECFKHTDSQADEKVGNGTALFASAQYGGSVLNSLKLTGLYNSNPEMRYVWVGPMKYATGEDLKQLATDGRGGSPVVFFPTTCSNVEAALTWLDYLNSEEGARLVHYGIEGDTYDFNADGQPRMNAELTERFAQDSESVRNELRERGINYMLGSALLADKRMEWWGEMDLFQADAEDPLVKEYKTVRPVEIMDGYPVDGLASGFEDYEDVAEFAFQGTTERDYRERAYFAATEAEARQILEDYQNYLLEQKGGLFNDFLDYLTEAASQRDDIVH